MSAGLDGGRVDTTDSSADGTASITMFRGVGMMTRGLVISVGGSPQPVAFSLDQQRPEKVVFFVSRTSRPEIEARIRPFVECSWTDQEVVTTADHEDLIECLKALNEQLHKCLENLGLRWEETIVDLTGGTKIMSTALALATVNRTVHYSYVGGKVRTKDGMGTVLDGREALLKSPNPWDELAVELRRRLARQLNRGHYAEAAETAHEASEKVGEEGLRYLYLGLKDICSGYQRWDAFDYSAAHNLIRQGFFPRFKPVAEASKDPALQELARHVGADLDRLAVLKNAVPASQKGKGGDVEGMHAIVVDLVASSIRRARLEVHPNDGVARLYSALEKLAKAALRRYGIDNSKARPEQLPEALREEYTRKYADGSGSLRFGLEASYLLLDALGDELGARYRDQQIPLSNLLEIRNQALLVHGWKPIAMDTYEQLLQVMLEMLGVREDEIPAPPMLVEE